MLIDMCDFDLNKKIAKFEDGKMERMRKLIASMTERRILVKETTPRSLTRKGTKLRYKVSRVQVEKIATDEMHVQSSTNATRAKERGKV